MATLKYRDPADGIFKPLSLGTTADPLPDQASAFYGGAIEVNQTTASTFATLPSPGPVTCSLTLPRPALVLIEWGCWFSVAGQTATTDVRTNVLVTGATSNDMLTWGDRPYVAGQGTTTIQMQGSSSRVITCNTGTTTFDLQAYRNPLKATSSGVCGVNYPVLRATPIQWLYGISGDNNDTGWISLGAPTYGSVAGGSTPGYRRLNGVVYLRGNVVPNGGTALPTGAMTNIGWTLPAGFRPAETLIFGATANTTTIISGQVSSGGAIAAYASAATAAWWSMGNVHFIADA